MRPSLFQGQRDSPFQKLGNHRLKDSQSLVPRRELHLQFMIGETAEMSAALAGDGRKFADGHVPAALAIEQLEDAFDPVAAACAAIDAVDA